MKAVKRLVRSGVDVNAKDNDGQTPLEFAIRNGKTEAADWLGAHGGRE
jgi:ankyrin repeat protein